jgi:hypothetical protein
MSRSRVTHVKVVGRVTPLLVGLALMMVLLGGCGMASRAPQVETAEGKSTSSVRLELSPTNNSRVRGSATIAKAATGGTRIKLELKGLPEPDEIYLAHVHPGSCENEEHSDAPGGETADYHGHEEHGDVHEQVNNDEAAADEIEYPLQMRSSTPCR